jgi:hypothetical protein
VAAYFPALPLVASTELRGAQVALVIPSDYDLVRPGQGEGGASNGCPSAS